MTATEILNNLLAMAPVRTADLPGDKIGIYGLVDHTGNMRYIGSTSAANENFRKRIHQRHRTGSETYSHYFSKVYNCGRMFQDRLTKQDNPTPRLPKTSVRLLSRSIAVPSMCRSQEARLKSKRMKRL